MGPQEFLIVALYLVPLLALIGLVIVLRAVYIAAREATRFYRRENERAEPDLN